MWDAKRVRRGSAAPPTRREWNVRPRILLPSRSEQLGAAVVTATEFAVGGGLLLLPVFVASEFPGHHAGDFRGGLDARPRIEQQGARATRKNVFDRARHLVPSGPEHFRRAIRQFWMKQFVPTGVLLGQRREGRCVRAIDSPVFARPSFRASGAVRAAMQPQVLGYAGTFLQAPDQRRLINGVGRRFAIGRPFASGDG